MARTLLLPWAADAVDSYARTFANLEKHVGKWTRVSLVWPNDKAIMNNEYVHLDVINWLIANVGAMSSYKRQYKYAWAPNWAYGVSGVVETDEGSMHPIRYIHTFFFKEPQDAVRFKLTWA